MKKLNIWDSEPHEDNFHRAERYLSLRLPLRNAQALVVKLRNADVEWQLADDVLRAARLRPLSPEDPAFRKHVRDILEEDQKMHPILVVHFGMRTDIADGYHATSIATWLGPQVGVPCLIA